MTDQVLTPNPILVPAQAPIQNTLVEKGKSIFFVVLNRFYSNKKIFLPIVIAFGLVFFVIILGVIFGNRTANQKALKTPTPAPTPTTFSTPSASQFDEVLVSSQKKLNDLKTQINALDVRQSRLKPPTLDFNVKF